MLHTWRGRGLVGVAALAVAPVIYAAVPSHASHQTSLVVVGTSDVVDSNLVAAVLKPGFETAYPHITLDYVSQGSGAAISTAEAGAASALLVHAATLENQFVADGYSDEPYGRAVFYGDYVLLGPPDDPAGVLRHAHHDIVTAFQRIAAAGAAGRANFVSRGGTPGTTVKEHAIWTLTRGASTCDVSTADGSGAAPSTAGGNCTASPKDPAWYHATGLNQAPNVQNADVCNYSHGNCYVLTDRGTFQYLQSIRGIHNLHIVTRNNAESAPGGSTLLVNSFHTYAVNPAKFTTDSHVHINLAAATAFLHWLTSPAAQVAVGAYMDSRGDPPFLPDAAPAISVSAPRPVASDRMAVTGSIRDVVPGTLPLRGIHLTLLATTSGSEPTPVTTATTDSHGRFALRFRPIPSTHFMVQSPPISRIEDPTIHPVFGDLLAAASAPVAMSRPRGAVSLDQPTEQRGKVRLSGKLHPAPDGRGHLVVLAAHANRAHSSGLHRVASRSPVPGKHAYHLRVSLRPGIKWVVQVKYVDRDLIKPGRSPRREIVV